MIRVCYFRVYVNRSRLFKYGKCYSYSNLDFIRSSIFSWLNHKVSFSFNEEDFYLKKHTKYDAFF